MAKISLNLYGENAELSEIDFEHPLLTHSTRAVRGRTRGAHSGYGSFPWGSVAKGLTVLLLRAKISGEKGTLEGGNGTLAASLDYAISKPPVWFEEVFGVNKRGESLIRRIISRTNPERKRPGPVRLSINSIALTANDISIKFNGVQKPQLSEIEELLSRLENSLGLRAQTEFTSDECPTLKKNRTSHFEFRRQLAPHYAREVAQALRFNDIFTDSGTQRILAKMGSNPSFTRIVPKSTVFLNSLKGEGSSRFRLGCCEPAFLDRNLKTDAPLKVWVTAVQPANYALVKYLRDIKGYNLSIDYRFNYGTELARETVSSTREVEPDICFAGIGPSAHIYNETKGRYLPWIIAPTLSHAILGRQDAETKNLSKGEFYFVTDEPTTASFCFDELLRDGQLASTAIAMRHTEPESVMELYASADKNFRSLLWFPNYAIFEELHASKLMTSAHQTAFNQATIGFAHERMRRNKPRFTAFQVALRDAWLTLREDPIMLQSIITNILSDEDYTKFVSRACGLYNFAKAA